MASESSDRPPALSSELIALIEAVSAAERERNARLEAKLAQLDAQMRESERIQQLITGGAARREARLRALENMVEAMAAERARMPAPRPLDLPGRTRFDPSVVDMRGRDETPTD
jgi:hypothetical protein